MLNLSGKEWDSILSTEVNSPQGQNICVEQLSGIRLDSFPCFPSKKPSGWMQFAVSTWVSAVSQVVFEVPQRDTVDKPPCHALRFEPLQMATGSALFPGDSDAWQIDDRGNAHEADLVEDDAGFLRSTNEDMP